MKVIGILGGVGSGKSTVARLFEQAGAVRIDADRIGHLVLQLPEVRELVLARFGEQVFDSDGSISRPALAKIVFAPGAEGQRALADLEAMTHPRITQRIEREISRERLAGTKLLLLDAPVLLKARWSRFCDHVLFVDAPPELRQARVAVRGWTQEEWLRREQSQESLDVKRAASDIVVDNGGSLEQTAAQVKDLLARWSEIPG